MLHAGGSVGVAGDISALVYTDKTKASLGGDIKAGGDVILPLTEDNRTFVAYSEGGSSGCRNVPDAAFGEASVWEISPEGNRYLETVPVRNGTVRLDVKPGQALVLFGKG